MYARRLNNNTSLFARNIPLRVFQRTVYLTCGCVRKIAHPRTPQKCVPVSFSYAYRCFPSFLFSSRLPILFYFSLPNSTYLMEFRKFSRIRLHEYFWHRPVNVFWGKINFCLFPFQTNSGKRLTSSIPTIVVRYVRRILISLLLFFVLVAPGKQTYFQNRI